MSKDEGSCEEAYEAALRALNELQSSPDAIKARHDKRRSQDLKESDALEKVKRWFAALGYKPGDFDRMNIIHIAGTKGKGSTCILLNNFLKQRFQNLIRPIKVGLYTSPHIRKPTERIRINSVAISDNDFAQYVFEVLGMLKKSDNLQRDGMPTYFRFMTLVAFHYFMSKDVEVAIIEVGVGGEYDSTNIISKPLAVGITTIHLDHQSQLGSTLEDIAWHKAGILKPSARAFTVVQKEAVHGVIDERARAVNVEVTTVRDLQWLVSDVIKSKGQRENAALAAHLASVVFEKLLKFETSQRAIDLEFPDNFASSQLLAGLERTHLPARGEITRSNGATWFLDGAHTIESVELAVQNYMQRSFAAGVEKYNPSKETSQRSTVLVFNQQGRKPLPLLKEVFQQLSQARPSFVVFCTNQVRHEKAGLGSFHNANIDFGALQRLEVQHQCRQAWESWDPRARVEVIPCVQDVVTTVGSYCGTVEGEITVLVVGSVHLIGAFYEVFDMTASIDKACGARSSSKN